MNDRQMVITGDGSHTISVPALNVSYHSIHGAIQESIHVFIEAGLNHFLLHNPTNQPISIFEMGLGTGLNALLTAIEAERRKINIYYIAIDAFPLSPEEAFALNYTKTLEHDHLFEQLHISEWNKNIPVNEYFTFRKEKIDLKDFSTSQQFSVIYYDAFAPNAQPELWTKEIFEKLFSMLLTGGVLTTYCSKGDVRRAMMAAGFTVTKLPGPPRKREMLLAEKINLKSS